MASHRACRVRLYSPDSDPTADHAKDPTRRTSLCPLTRLAYGAKMIRPLTPAADVDSRIMFVRLSASDETILEVAPESQSTEESYRILTEGLVQLWERANVRREGTRVRWHQ